MRWSQLDLDLLAREGAGHEHDPTVGVAGQGLAAGHQRSATRVATRRASGDLGVADAEWSASDGGRSVTAAA